MLDRPLWFDCCIIGAVFLTILLPASADLGFFTFVLNAVGVALFVTPMVMAVKSGELSDR